MFDKFPILLHLARETPTFVAISVPTAEGMLNSVPPAMTGR
jgi:hypothetical protein